MSKEKWLVERVGPDGNTRIMPISVHPAVVDYWLENRRDLPLIQDFFPMCDDDEREFILTGITPKFWAELYPEVKV